MLTKKCTLLTTKAGVITTIPTKEQLKPVSINKENYSLFSEGGVNIIFSDSYEPGQTVVSKVAVLDTDKGFFLKLIPFKVKRNEIPRYRINKSVGQQAQVSIDDLFVKI